jgi:hypothetical protein
MGLELHKNRKYIDQKCIKTLYHGVTEATRRLICYRPTIEGWGPPATSEYIQVYQIIYNTSNTSEVTTHGTCLQNIMPLVATKFSRECFVTTPKYQKVFRYRNTTNPSPVINQESQSNRFRVKKLPIIWGVLYTYTECPESHFTEKLNLFTINCKLSKYINNISFLSNGYRGLFPRE